MLSLCSLLVMPDQQVNAAVWLRAAPVPTQEQPEIPQPPAPDPVATTPEPAATIPEPVAATALPAPLADQPAPAFEPGQPRPAQPEPALGPPQPDPVIQPDPVTQPAAPADQVIEQPGPPLTPQLLLAGCSQPARATLVGPLFAPPPGQPSTLPLSCPWPVMAPALAQVPPVAGQSVLAARHRLGQAGLPAGLVTVPGSVDPSDVVLDSDPPAFSAVDPGSVVTLFVAPAR